jgi:tetratricopeptide (TPR) repeat protein
MSSLDPGLRPAPAFDAESEAYTLFHRGVTLLRERHPAQAALLLARALSLEPGRTSIREALGRAEYALGRYEAAAGHFAAVAADVPDNDYARYALGRCLLRLGRREEGQGQLRLARALRPQSDLYRAALDELD